MAHPPHHDAAPDDDASRGGADASWIPLLPAARYRSTAWGHPPPAPSPAAMGHLIATEKHCDHSIDEGEERNPFVADAGPHSPWRAAAARWGGHPLSSCVKDRTTPLEAPPVCLASRGGLTFLDWFFLFCEAGSFLDAVEDLLSMELTCRHVRRYLQTSRLWVKQFDQFLRATRPHARFSLFSPAGNAAAGGAVRAGTGATLCVDPKRALLQEYAQLNALWPYTADGLALELVFANPRRGYQRHHDRMAPPPNGVYHRRPPTSHESPWNNVARRVLWRVDGTRLEALPMFSTFTSDSFHCSRGGGSEGLGGPPPRFKVVWQRNERHGRPYMGLFLSREAAAPTRPELMSAAWEPPQVDPARVVFCVSVLSRNSTLAATGMPLGRESTGATAAFSPLLLPSSSSSARIVAPPSPPAAAAAEPSSPSSCLSPPLLDRRAQRTAFAPVAVRREDHSNPTAWRVAVTLAYFVAWISEHGGLSSPISHPQTAPGRENSGPVASVGSPSTQGARGVSTWSGRPSSDAGSCRRRIVISRRQLLAHLSRDDPREWGLRPSSYDASYDTLASNVLTHTFAPRETRGWLFPFDLVAETSPDLVVSCEVVELPKQPATPPRPAGGPVHAAQLTRRYLETMCQTAIPVLLNPDYTDRFKLEVVRNLAEDAKRTPFRWRYAVQNHLTPVLAAILEDTKVHSIDLRLAIAGCFWNISDCPMVSASPDAMACLIHGVVRSIHDELAVFLKSAASVFSFQPKGGDLHPSPADHMAALASRGRIPASPAARTRLTLTLSTLLGCLWNIPKTTGDVIALLTTAPTLMETLFVVMGLLGFPTVAGFDNNTINGGHGQQQADGEVGNGSPFDGSPGMSAGGLDLAVPPPTESDDGGGSMHLAFACAAAPAFDANAVQAAEAFARLPVDQRHYSFFAWEDHAARRHQPVAADGSDAVTCPPSLMFVIAHLIAQPLARLRNAPEITWLLSKEISRPNSSRHQTGSHTTTTTTLAGQMSTYLNEVVSCLVDQQAYRAARAAEELEQRDRNAAANTGSDQEAAAAVTRPLRLMDLGVAIYHRDLVDFFLPLLCSKQLACVALAKLVWELYYDDPSAGEIVVETDA